jgi:hypothetical protein
VEKINNAQSHLELEKTVPYNVILQVLKRDNHTCQHPGCESQNVEIHHIEFRSQGGRHVSSNLVCLCLKHHEFPHKYIKWREYWERWTSKKYYDDFQICKQLNLFNV